jgi:hypothetical protein
MQGVWGAVSPPSGEREGQSPLASVQQRMTSQIAERIVCWQNKDNKDLPKLPFVIFFASAALLCYNTAPLTGHGFASPGCRSLGLLCLHSWF